MKYLTLEEVGRERFDYGREDGHMTKKVENEVMGSRASRSRRGKEHSLP